MNRLSIQFSDRGSVHEPEEAQAHIYENKSYASSVISVDPGDRYSLMPLEKERRETRLLQLLPSSDINSTIECKLSVVCRDDGPIYSALSYAWGNATQIAPIQVNDLEWWVTETLYQALLHIRQPNDAVTLWVDAVCIDQKNDEEKSWHVQQMHETYAEAANVIAWLGPADDTEVDAMQMLKQIGEVALTLAPGADLWSDPTHDKVLDLYGKATAHETDTANPLEKLFQDIVDGNLQGLRFQEPATSRIFGRSWWQRVWVVQELSIPVNITFQCGHTNIPANPMIAAALLYYQYRTSVWSAQRDVPEESNIQKRLADFVTDDEEEDANCVYAQCTTRWAYHKWASSPSGLPLAFIISSTFAYDTTRVLAATDPRDYVFGLLGLATDVKSLGLIADYTKSNAEVYVSFSRALIQNGIFLPLSWCRTRGPNRLKDLPSWAADLSNRIKRPFQWYVHDPVKHGFKLDPAYSAGLGLTMQHNDHSAREPSSPLQSSPNTLHLRGILFDTVAHTSPSFDELHLRSSPDSQAVTRTCSEFLRELKKLLNLAPAASPYHTETSKAAAVWRTSTVDVEISPTWERKRSEGQIAKVQIDLYSNDFSDEEVISNLASLKSTLDAIDTTNLNRRPFVTAKGHLGLGPEETAPGDLVVVFVDAQMPIICRDDGTNGGVSVIGDSYVHGIMDGEAENMALAVEDFCIV